MNKTRCTWATQSESEMIYHDCEWGVPTFDDDKLFEQLILEINQSGLSWHTILNKRSSFKKAYDNFDPYKISQYDSAKVNSLMNNPDIIRHKLKIQAAIHNAQAFINIQAKYGSFANYFWKFTDFQPLVNSYTDQDVPSKTPLSEIICKDMKQHGFKFIGPTTIYAYMQAVGMVNDHSMKCYRRKEIINQYKKHE